jgi:hypothetical protein
MAEEKKSEPRKDASDPGEAPAISEATDGGDSRLTKGYKENPDKPGPDSVAQIEELHDEEPGG